MGPRSVIGWNYVIETSSCNLGKERNNIVHIFSCNARMITYYKKISCY